MTEWREANGTFPAKKRLQIDSQVASERGREVREAQVLLEASSDPLRVAWALTETPDTLQSENRH